ncbi:hypothetical protein FNH05_13240 [Amycolatopsis rhizosphaerae]|uniref:Uncharacterized protein n=1 Tax=Amycolatopsis rhizosphaerae TaxID=2053003 RepID=A0A558CTY8_9PSEU|nr:hypothetical protein [Amycolatopsis rhizosphaerae]TVT52239.1 hypothetical protein FNH05_13240 [Amycolatopsis rhizosphaerae]
MRYKAIVGIASKAGEDLRAWELHRAKELETEIAAAQAALAEAKEKEQRTAQAVRHWWRMAEDNVSRLSWLELADGPAPDLQARGSMLDRYLNEVKPLYQELVDAVLSLGWRSRH